MRIRLTSIHVSDQEQAYQFYTTKLGFQVSQDFPVGEFRWLTVVSPEEPEGTELLLEPNDNPAAQAYQQALHNQGIPAAAFECDDIQQEYDRLTADGVNFTSEPVQMGDVWIAVLDDTCGNLIQLYQTQ